MINDLITNNHKQRVTIKCYIGPTCKHKSSFLQHPGRIISLGKSELI